MNKKEKKLLDDLSNNLNWLADKVLEVLGTHDKEKIKSICNKVEHCCGEIKYGDNT
jgi:hypothetical protein